MDLVVNTSAITCPERLVSEMNYRVPSEMLNPTRSVTVRLGIGLVLSLAGAAGGCALTGTAGSLPAVECKNTHTRNIYTNLYCI